MFCTTCGTPIPEGSRFCTTCGAPAYAMPSPAPAPAPANGDLPAFNPFQNPGAVPPPFPNFNEQQPAPQPIPPQPMPPRPAPARKAMFEYKVVYGITTEELEDKLNEYAAEGWRIVPVSYGSKESIIFERKL